MPKYNRLYGHLITKMSKKRLDMTFGEIEDILGFRLPASARRYPAWWANQTPEGRPQVAAWLGAGWKSANVNIPAERLTFVPHEKQMPRDRVSFPIDERQRNKPVPENQNSLDETEISLKFAWRLIGSVSIDHRDRILFPDAPHRPGVYRFEFSGPGGRKIYFGETDDLARRFQHYRTPGPTQKTNQRLNESMKKQILGGGTVACYLACELELASFGQKSGPRMAEKHVRRLFELAAITNHDSKKSELLNL